MAPTPRLPGSNPKIPRARSHRNGGGYAPAPSPSCGALPPPAGEGRQGAEAALVSGGTTAPLSPTENIAPGSWEMRCRFFISTKPKQCVRPEVPTGTRTEP